MKTPAQLVPKIIAILLLVSCTSTYSKPEEQVNETETQKIMLALLLDTSNSMDGLIDQAKSQLWTIVNELATARCADGKQPEVKIALFEYGNDRLPASEGYIRMVVNLTDDLDEISKNLFQLTTNGGDEYCGQVVKKSIDKLEWSQSKADLKMIFIAGNEPFTQGRISYKSACSLARDQDIVVNTIFCGDHNEGISTSWKSGADLTGGSYMSIEQNLKTVYIKTPYDTEIDRLNDELNKTYLYYGAQGKEKKDMQAAEDMNAESYGQANKVKRVISKSSHIYKNKTWDLVDAAEDNTDIVLEVEEESLPSEMQGMSNEEKLLYVEKQAKQRNEIKSEIQTLNAKRKLYIAENDTSEQSAGGMLDKVMIQSIKEVAKTKQLNFQ